MVFSTWANQIKRIQQATKLNIELFSCALEDWPKERQNFESQGGEVVQQIRENDRIHYIGIKPDEWPEAARAMLSLVFPLPQAAPSWQEQMTEWLQQIWKGDHNSPMPAGISGVHWAEPRLCFVLERIGEHSSKADWRKLLQQFFPERVPFQLMALHSSVYLLLVPVSILMESADEQEPEQLGLEWAYSLHDLLTAEASEAVRVLVARSVVNPSFLQDEVRSLHNLLRVLTTIFPDKRVAATWQYRLEQWAFSIDAEVKKRLLDTFPVQSADKLTQEQRDLLDELFRQNLNISETARSLFIHRNTLLYRLDKITEVTGLDPRIFKDAVLLRLSVLFRHST